MGAVGRYILFLGGGAGNKSSRRLVMLVKGIAEAYQRAAGDRLRGAFASSNSRILEVYNLHRIQIHKIVKPVEDSGHHFLS